MIVSFQCPSCRARLRLGRENLGKRIICPRCRSKFTAAAAGVGGPAARRPVAVPAPAPPARTPFPRSSRPTDDERSHTVEGTPLMSRPFTGPRPLPPEYRAGLPPEPPPRRQKGRGGLLLVCGLLVLLAAAAGGGYVLYSRGFFARHAGGPNPAPSGETDKGNQAPPQNAVFGKHGIIEIGSTGIKVLVIDAFAAGDGYDFTVDFKDNANINLVSAVDKKEFTPQGLDEAAEQVRRFHTLMREKHGVPAERIYVAASSGLFVPFKGDAEALEKNQKALAERVKGASGGGKLYFATAGDEGRLALLAAKKAGQRKDWLIVDIGGGNTKGGYFEGADSFISFDLANGSKVLTKKVGEAAKKREKPFDDVVVDVVRESLAGPAREEVQRKQGIVQQKKLLLGGGIAWAMANYTHPGDIDHNHFRLTVDDLKRFRELSKLDHAAARAEVLQQVAGDEKKTEKVKKELDNIQKIFPREQLRTGAEILLVLAEEYKFGDKEEIEFNRKSDVLWALGFILERNGLEN